jgi:antitoxin component of MazEF toxin-antitoxin module
MWIICVNTHVSVERRRIGNSLGIIVPKSALHAWGLGEGDTLELTTRGIGPPRQRDAHDVLVEHKRKLAAAVATRIPERDPRA